MVYHFLNIRLISLIFVVFFSSCYYDNKEELYPSDCDITDVSLSSDIMPILNAHCNSCHSNISANEFGGGVFLEKYSDIKNSVDNSTIIGTINDKDGFEQMPIDYTLSECNIKKIEAWINEGGFNN